LVGFTSIGRSGKSNRYLAVTARFNSGHFEEESYNSEMNLRYKLATEKAGMCQALASKLDESNFQDFVYFGKNKIAISFAHNEVSIKCSL